MTYNISKLSLFGAYFTLSLSVSTFLPSTLVASDFNKDLYFEKKYTFSKPVLSMNKLVGDLCKADKEKSLHLLSILEEEGKKQNVEVQEKLYLFYSIKIGTLNFIDTQKAEALLKRGLKQQQAWAYWEFAQKNKKSEKEVTKEHFLAANLSYPKAIKYIEANDRDDWISLIKSFMSKPNKAQKKDRNFAINRINNIKTFYNKYNEQCYALPLVRLYQHVDYLSSDKLLHSSIVKSAADLGNGEAQFYYAQQQYAQNNLALAVAYFQRAGNQRNSDAMYNAGVLLMQGFEGQVPDKKRALDLYIKAADLGNFKAMYNAGLLLMQGFEGQAPDQKRALAFYMKASDLGNSDAMCNAGLLLMQGFEGQIPDKKRALDLYIKAADLGNSDAMYNAGVLLEQGFEGHNPDQKRALDYFRKAANLRNPKAMFNAGILLEQGFEGQVPNKKEALDFFIKAADREHTFAMCNAGVLLEQGFEGQISDKKRALDLYTKAADLGNSSAMFNAGLLLAQGFEGQAPDKKRALDLYIKAADLGNSNAMFNVGLLLMQGFEGQAPDKKRALDLYMKASDLGNSDAMFNAALLLAQGFEGQIPDKKRALDLYIKVADREHTFAMCNAGVLLEQGFEGQIPDKKRALDLYIKAADLGNSNAMFNAALLLAQSFEGQISDKKRALALYIKAADLGNSNAMYNAALLLAQGFERQIPDKDRALQYLQQVANQNLPIAMVNLATIYLQSYNSDKNNQEDLNTALFWLEKAHALGEEKASLYLNIAHGYLNELRPSTEEENSQLEKLLQDTKNPILKETIQLSSQSHFPSENRSKFNETLEEEASSSEEEKNISDSDKEENSIIEEYLPFKEGNIKKIRENLRQMALLRKERDSLQEKTLTCLTLSSRNQAIAEAILKEEAKEITYNDLYTLFKDPAFRDQVKISKTKSGICISAHNRDNNQHASVSTHHKHTKFYKGIQPAFIKDLKHLLEIFPNINLRHLG